MLYAPSALHSAPNPAHVSLAMLCIPELLHHLASDAEFTLITQNIDGLSVRAYEDALKHHQGTSGSSRSSYNGSMNTTITKDIPESHIYEMHGRVLDTLCTQCSNLRHDGKSPLCPALAHAKTFNDPYHPIPVDELPHCEQPECGGLLRPGVIWFDEVPRNSREIWRKVDEADLCLVIGTSSTVNRSHPCLSCNGFIIILLVHLQGSAGCRLCSRNQGPRWKSGNILH